MPEYAGTSNIEHYETGADFIEVRYTNGKTYRFSAASVGPKHAGELKRLAESGSGLASYIAKHCRGLHEKQFGRSDGR